MRDVWVAIIGCLSLAIGAVTSYFVARRQHSGTVDSSDAETIFKAAEELRTEQRAELVKLRQDVQASQIEILSLRAEITSLRTEITSLRAESTRLQAEADQLRAEAAVSKSEAAILRRKVAETEAALSVVRREVSGALILDTPTGDET